MDLFYYFHVLRYGRRRLSGEQPAEAASPADFEKFGQAGLIIVNETAFEYQRFEVENGIARTI
jgi:hypothetical protein